MVFNSNDFLDPKESYNSKKLSEAFGAHKNLGELEKRVREQDSTSTREEVGKFLAPYDNPDFYKGDIQQYLVSDDISVAQHTLLKRIVEHAKAHLNDYIGKVDEGGLLELLKQLSLSEIEGDEKYNKLVKALQESRLIDAVVAGQIPVQNYIESRIGKLPDNDIWKISYINHGRASQAYMNAILQSYALSAKRALLELTTDAEGKPDKEKIKGTFRKALNSAKDNEKDAYYFNLAKAAYETEEEKAKKKEAEEKSEEKSEKS